MNCLLCIYIMRTQYKCIHVCVSIYIYITTIPPTHIYIYNSYTSR